MRLKDAQRARRFMDEIVGQERQDQERETVGLIREVKIMTMEIIRDLVYEGEIDWFAAEVNRRITEVKEGKT